MKSFFAKRLFDGFTLHSNVRFEVNKTRVTAFYSDSEDESNAEVIHELVIPAMVDVQVNGGGGVQFNETPTLSTLQQMAKAYLNVGTGSLMPTIITDDIDVMNKGADAIALGHKWDPGAIPGVHFEGPHLSIAKKGMHSAKHIRSLSDKELALFTRDDLGKVIVTLAPEAVLPSDIEALTSAGVIVSIGHTNATSEDCFTAFNAGATGATHLFNAMSPFTSREPGVVGASLYRDDVYCGLIVDHHHVHPVSATLAIKLKGDKRLMLVTDAMAPAASDVDHFVYQGTKVMRKNNTLRLEDGTLAGSLLTMEQAIQHTHFDLNIDLQATLRMATSTPAAFIKSEANIGTLRTGAVANFVTLDESLKVTRCWRNGELAQ